MQIYIMVLLISSFLGAFFFLCTLKAYVTGLKHGKLLVNKEVPTFEPVKEVVQHFETKKEEKQIESVMEDYWS